MAKTWLVTGGAGFIGSHIVEELLRRGHFVTTLDNYSTSKKSQLLELQKSFGAIGSQRLQMIDGDIRNVSDCERACVGVDYVLHLAALGSVPISMQNPQLSLDINGQGFVNVIESARRAGVRRFVYSSSSAVYGDDSRETKIESKVGAPLSPYAAGKKMNELTAAVYQRCYGGPTGEEFRTVGLRYFNVFGPRQSPDGSYAAVIPQWILRLISGQSAIVYGDGSTTRDFCPVSHVVQANLQAAEVEAAQLTSAVYNVGLGQRLSLRDLHANIVRTIIELGSHVARPDLEFAPWRDGDILHSQADATLAQRDLKLSNHVAVDEGLRETIQWFLKSEVKRP